MLHKVGNELSLASSAHDLCRRAVLLGRSCLGFDRLSTWFVDSDPKFIIGSFGVDEKGRLREETLERVATDSDPVVKQIRADKVHSVLRKDVSLRDHSGKVVGQGSHIVAAIWNGKEVVGYLSVDNFLRQEQLTEHDREIVELFASTFGHLYSLKKTEEALHLAYDRLKDVQDQLIQAAKMEVVGSLATGVAHEVKNPLAVMLQGVDYLSKKIKPKDERGHAALLHMRLAVKKADIIIKGLLDFALVSKLDFTSGNINNVIDASLVLINYELDNHHIKVKRDFENNIPEVKIDKNKIEQVFINIFLNAVNHMQKGGELTIKTYSNTAAKKKKVFVEIEDTGTGIPEKVLSKVFDPFFTTRRGAGGTGLGLTIAKSIIDMHKASVIISNKNGGHGAKVVLTFKA